MTRDGFARVHLTADALRRGLALVMPEAVIVDRVMARPAGVGRALTTYRIPIEGREEWLAAAAEQLA